MKKNHKIIICIISLICVIAAITAIIFTSNKQMTLKKKQAETVVVGFYDLPDSQKNAFTEVITKLCSSNEIPVSFYNIQKESDFTTQINENKINLVLAQSGYAVKNAVEAASTEAQINPDLLSGMFSSAQNSLITTDKKIKALPVLFDNMEINIETSEFYESGLQNVATWDDIQELSVILQKKLKYPVSLAGAEPVFLLDLLGALGEAFEGEEAYESAATILQEAAETKKAQGKFDALETVNKIFINPDAPIPYSLYFLKQLSKKGFITPSAKDLIHQDIDSLIELRQTDIFFTTLSVHRTYDEQALSRFSTIYIPSQTNLSKRHLTATATYAVPLSESKNIATVIEGLLSYENQSQISTLTGLAPVLANCSTPDQQANDARFWIAASSTPFAGLGHEAELSDSDLQSLAKEIQVLLFY